MVISQNEPGLKMSSNEPPPLSIGIISTDILHCNRRRNNLLVGHPIAKAKKAT